MAAMLIQRGTGDPFSLPYPKHQLQQALPRPSPVCLAKVGWEHQQYVSPSEMDQPPPLGWRKRGGRTASRISSTPKEARRSLQGWPHTLLLITAQHRASRGVGNARRLVIGSQAPSQPRPLQPAKHTGTPPGLLRGSCLVVSPAKPSSHFPKPHYGLWPQW